jgi:hypothetical protein
LCVLMRKYDGDKKWEAGVGAGGKGVKRMVPATPETTFQNHTLSKTTLRKQTP